MRFVTLKPATKQRMLHLLKLCAKFIQMDVSFYLMYQASWKGWWMIEVFQSTAYRVSYNMDITPGWEAMTKQEGK